MTLPEIDHVSFLVEHAQTFFAGEVKTSKPAVVFKAEKLSAQASAHPLSQAQGGLFCVLTVLHELRTFAPCKAFLFDLFAFFSSLENYFGFRTTNVKGKTALSVSLRWNKRF